MHKKAKTPNTPDSSPALPDSEKPVAKRKSFRAGAFKVPVVASPMQGERGNLARRYKQHLLGLSKPRQPVDDPDEVMPPLRPARLRPNSSLGLHSRPLVATDSDEDSE